MMHKAILAGKERRKPYRDSKAIDGTCRNHGGCSFCESNRLRGRRRQDEAARQERIEAGSP